MPNWYSLKQVFLYAQSLGVGHTVFKRKGLDTYGIMHTENEPKLLMGAKVYFRTK